MKRGERISIPRVSAAGLVRALPLIALLATLGLLPGCSGPGYAPVSDRTLDGSRRAVPVKSSRPAGGYYTVQTGDTLYSIAFRYGLNYRNMARANGISSDYRIYPGQRLRLSEVAPKAASPTAAKPRTTVAARPTASKPAEAPAARAAEQRSSTANRSPISWRWPAEGRVLRTFRSRGQVNKGIDIAGNRGDPVNSAASGRVVYAGSGLLGYGNLIIINHNEQYLSAYAHNSRLLVKENQTVKSGQKIAEIGNSGATRTMLHFEIRKDGKPVNPLHYLPKR